jgi:uncharacterized protein
MPRSATKVAKPLDREALIVRLRAMLPELREKYHVRSLGLFGSYARGEADARSDVDLLVEFDVTPGFFRFEALSLEIEGALGVKVDLVTRGALKPNIGRRILAELLVI